MDERRNALSPELERQKKKEAKTARSRAPKLPDQVYAIYHIVNSVVKYFYVGIAVDPKSRWAQHVREARSGQSSLPEYEQMRYVGVEHCYMEVLDETGEFTEREWYDALKAEGYVLLNDESKLVSSKRKRREKYEHQAELEGVFKKRTLEEAEAWWVKVMKAAHGEPIV